MSAARDGIRALLSHIGEDPTREGLKDTPERVIKALWEMTRGMEEDPQKILKTTFEAGAYDEAIVVAPIAFVSVCEHHLLPFTGHAAVAYLPGEVAQDNGPPLHRVVGLSKLARLVDVYARRLQLQERMTTQLAQALQDALRPRGVAVIVRAEHACMSCRGVRKPGARMVTSALYGSFRTTPEARAEVMGLIERAWG